MMTEIKTSSDTQRTECKGMQRHERFPHFPQSGNRDTGMSQASMTESREITRKLCKAIHSKRPSINQDRTLKHAYITHRKGRKRDTGKRKWGNKQKT